MHASPITAGNNPSPMPMPFACGELMNMLAAATVASQRVCSIMGFCPPVHASFVAGQVIEPDLSCMRKMSLGICFVPCVIAPQFASLSLPPEPPAPEPVMIGVEVVVAPLMPLVVESVPELLPPAVPPEVLAEPVFDPVPPAKVDPALLSPHPFARARATPMKRSESAEPRPKLIGSSASTSGIPASD